MDEDRIAGAAQKMGGSVKSAVGNLAGDAKLQAEGAADKAAGAVQNAVGGAKDAVREAAESVSETTSDLGRRASRLVEDGVPPALAEYGRQAKDAVVAGAESAAGVVRGYPLATLGVVAVLAFLVGRVTAEQPRHHAWPWER